jgi:hypothetical protein
LQKVYACAFKYKNIKKLYYIDNNNNFNNIIPNMFNDIFNCFDDKKDKNIVFYAHYLSGFDGYFVIDPLLNSGFEINNVIRKNTGFISFKIKQRKIVKNNNGEDVIINKTITMLDSSLILPNSLKSLSSDFKCEIPKSNFPHKFVSKDNLNYIGVTPPLEFWFNMNENEFNTFKTPYYNLKLECLKYLNADIESLHSIIHQFREIIYNDYKLDITKYKTSSSLAWNIYCTNDYQPDFNIPILKGFLAAENRKAYFGGQVYLRPTELDEIIEGYFYDKTAMYPSVMREDMPVGDPILSNDPNLDNYFGTCYAIITPPKDLIVPLIGFRNDEGIIEYPNTPFFGIYTSVELQGIIKYGYKVQVFGGYKFERGKNIFKTFVDSLWNKRIKAIAEGKHAQAFTKIIL